MTEEEMKARITELEAEATAETAAKKALLNEKIKAQKTAQELKDKVEAFEAQASEAEDAKATTGDLQAQLTALQNKYNKDVKARDDTIATYKASESKRLIGDTVAAGLKDYDISKEARALLERNLTLGSTVEGETIMFDGADLADHIKSYMSGEGKVFIRAPANSGGVTALGMQNGNAVSTAPKTAEEQLAFYQSQNKQ